MTPLATHSPWRWIVLMSSMLNLLLNSSINYNAGVIGVSLVDTFAADPVHVSWLMAMYSCMFALVAPLASIVINVTDCRTCVVLSGLVALVGYVISALVQSMPMLFVAYGLTGVAQSLCQSGAVLILSYYFPHSLHLVHGVCLTGSGMGAFLHPVLSQSFIDAYGFRGAMLMMGGLAFHSAFLGLLLRPTPLEIKLKASNARTADGRWKTLCSKIIPPAAIFKVPAFCTFVFAIFFYSITIQVIVVALPGYIKDHIGLSAQEGSLAAMMFGGGGLISRFLAGIAASDKQIGDSLLFFGMASMLSVLSFCGSFIMQLPQGVYIYSFFFGVYIGGMVSLTTSMGVTILGVEKGTHAYGVTMLAYGLGGLIGPPALAWLLQTQGSQMLFIFCGTSSLACAILSASSIYLSSQKQTTPTTGSSSDYSDTVKLRIDDMDLVINEGGKGQPEKNDAILNDPGDHDNNEENETSISYMNNINSSELEENLLRKNST